jgi:hypothetical protein
MVNLISGEKWGNEGQGVVGTVISNFGWLKRKKTKLLFMYFALRSLQL